MSNGDYGYFGKGDTGYAQYMTAFNRNFGGSSGGGGGGGNHNNNGGGGGDGSATQSIIFILFSPIRRIQFEFSVQHKHPSSNK